MFKPDPHGLKVTRRPHTNLMFDSHPDSVSAFIWDWTPNMSIGNPKDADTPQPFFITQTEEQNMGKPNTFESSAVVQAIIRGDFDSELKGLTEAIKSRRTIVRQIENTAKRAEFKVGDRVRFIDLRPKYMIGLEATITEFLRTKIAVKVVEEHKDEARRFAHGQIVVSPSMIEKV